jgi:hypothetical protein
MLLRDRQAGKSPAGPQGPEATCGQLPLVARMAMDRPEGLQREPWASHLRMCAACRAEAAGHALSLAVFQAIEGRGLADRASALPWESFLAVLERQQADEVRARSRAWWGIPLAATAAGVLAVAGVLAWEGLQNDPAAPARIVRVLPHEQRSMEDLVRWTLEPEGRRADRLLTVADASDRWDGLGVELPDWWDANELAASVTLRDEANGQTSERAAPATGLAVPASDALERRPLPLTQPASNRFGQGQPLFRLERGILPTQAVSFSAGD